jgi:lipopolysaccharide/colanic/teichoic acid biosynthesis glycosyltransferase
VAVYVLEALAARCSDVELVQNPEDLDLLRRFRIVAPSRARLLGNGVDLARFDWHRPALRGARARVRRKLGVREEQVLVGIVGRLVAEKGYPELFEAMRELGDEYILVAIGPDDPEKADAIPATELRRAERHGVRCLGLRSDVEALYQAMDVFVLPSHREGFPRAAMEAAAMQLPLVVTDVRGCREVVDDGDNGFLVPAHDPSSLAKAIRRMGEDTELRRQMGDASGRIARKRFDERRVVGTVLATYRDLAARKGIGESERRSHRRRPVARAAKRAIDIVGAATALVIASPVLGVISLAVRVTMGRPVLFRQERPGLDGRVFTIYKFRTMRDAVDADGRQLPDADRVTWFGQVLRAMSLDELPELWNVLRGDMSLVGPRPLLVEYLSRYTAEQQRRHDVRPGITGWAQINGRNNQTWEDRFGMDLWYVDNWTIALDLRVLARTLPAVLHRRGIAEPGHATKPNFQAPLVNS